MVVKKSGDSLSRCEYVLEHRKIFNELMGGALTGNEVVHHLDHNRQNNHINNLMVLSPSNHGRIHKRHRQGNS